MQGRLYTFWGLRWRLKWGILYIQILLKYFFYLKSILLIFSPPLITKLCPLDSKLKQTLLSSLFTSIALSLSSLPSLCLYCSCLSPPPSLSPLSYFGIVHIISISPSPFCLILSCLFDFFFFFFFFGAWHLSAEKMWENSILIFFGW